MTGAPHPDIASLRRVRNLSRLDDRQLEALAAELEVETAEPGQCLFEPGSREESSLYLVINSFHPTSGLASLDLGLINNLFSAYFN